MAESGMRKADVAAFGALFVVALMTNISLALWTDIDSPVRWAITIGAGIAAAVITYVVVSRRGTRRGGRG